MFLAFFCLGFLLYVVHYVVHRRVVVAAGHIAVVRHVFTQEIRRVGQGFHFLLPWEETVEFKLPDGANDSTYRQLHPARVLRCGPGTYIAQTKDHIDVEIELLAEFTISNMDALTSHPNVDYRSWLEDRVAEKALVLVAEMPRKQLNARALAARFDAVEWPKGRDSLAIVRVGVHNIGFDERMQVILRAESMGLDPDDVIEHVERMHRVHKNKKVGMAVHTPGIVC